MERQEVWGTHVVQSVKVINSGVCVDYGSAKIFSWGVWTSEPNWTLGGHWKDLGSVDWGPTILEEKRLFPKLFPQSWKNYFVQTLFQRADTLRVPFPGTVQRPSLQVKQPQTSVHPPTIWSYWNCVQVVNVGCRRHPAHSPAAKGQTIKSSLSHRRRFESLRRPVTTRPVIAMTRMLNVMFMLCI